MTEELIFIGGVANTGTRIICSLLREKDYEIISHNKADDYMDIKFREMFLTFWNSDRKDDKLLPLISCIKADIKNKKKCVIKHGHLMLIIPQLNFFFSHCKIIVMTRHVVDLVLKNVENLNYNEYLCIKKPTHKEKFSMIKKWYDKAIPDIDCLIKMEDLIFNKKETIERLYHFAGCDDKITSKILEIVRSPSKTVGKYVTVLKNPYYKEIFEYSINILNYKE